MTKVLQLRRGTTAQNDAFTGAVGEVTVDTTKKTLRLHDGSTKGGKEIIGKSDLATVATSGSYNDLSNKPTIPAAVTVDSALSATSTNPVQNKLIYSALAGKMNTVTLATVATSGSYSDLKNRPSLATVATSGSYSDLSNKPTIPTSGSVVTIVSSSYDSTTGSWYRKWSDGYIEQGAICNLGKNTSQSITLFVPFSSANYNVQVSIHAVRSTFFVFPMIRTVSTTSFSFDIYNVGDTLYAMTAFWYAYGV